MNALFSSMLIFLVKWYFGIPWKIFNPVLDDLSNEFHISTPEHKNDMREEPMSLSIDYEADSESLVFHKLADDTLDDPDLDVENEKLTTLAVKCCESDNSYGSNNFHQSFDFFTEFIP